MEQPKKKAKTMQSEIPNGVTIIPDVRCRPNGIYYGIEQKRASLFLISAKHDLLYNQSDIPINSFDVLPSYAPLGIEYTLVIKVDQRVDFLNKYQIVRIQSVRRVTVRKKDIIDFLMYKKINSIAWLTKHGKPNPDNIKEQRQFFNKQLKPLPATIYTINDVKGQFEGLEYIIIDIKNALRAAFQCDIFYELLCYFPEKFLFNLNSEKMEWLYNQLILNPYAFSFWNVISANVGKETKLFNDEKVKIFDLPNNMFFVKDIEDSLLRSSSDLNTMELLSVKYTSYFPVLSYYKIAYLLEDRKKVFGEDRYKNLVDHLPLFRKSFAFYIEWCKQFYTKGGNVLTLSDYNFFRVKEHPEYVLTCEEYSEVCNFMDTIGAMKKTKTIFPFYGRGESNNTSVSANLPGLSMTRYFLEETKIAQFITMYTKKLRWIHCPYYDTLYLDFIRSLFQDYTESNDGKNDIFLMTVNDSCKNYLSKTALNVLTVQEVIVELNGHKGKIDVNRGTVVVIDRFHKVGLNLVYDLFRSLTLAGRHKTRIELVLIGDKNERGAIYQHGGGYLFLDMLYWIVNRTGLISSVETVQEELPWVAIEPVETDVVKKHNDIAELYQSIESSFYTHITSSAISQEKGLKDEIGDMEKIINTKIAKYNKEQLKQYQAFDRPVDYYFFCSNEERKDNLLTVIYDLKGHTYSKRQFIIGYKVYVVETDHIGYIQDAKKYESKDNWIPVDTNEPIEVSSGRYKIQIDGKIYDSSQYTFQHAAATNINRFCAQPKEHCLFYVTEETTKTELLNCLKYSINTPRFLLGHKVSLTGVYERMLKFPRSDFECKLRSEDLPR